jgi:dimethylhistidine N-methyltransferase
MTMTGLLASSVEWFRADVLAGLSQRQKCLPAKYFYDAAGSQLFDRITELPEYYPTRTEVAIVTTAASAMASRCGPECLLVELGAGSLTKVRLLLDWLERPAGYVPVDVSGKHLRDSAAVLADDYPELTVRPLVADFSRSFRLPQIAAARRVVFFPGSTIGNFDPAEADILLCRVARLVGREGGLLLGIDLQKEIALIERAYNDAEGVTAAFNRNLLIRINRELGADFDPDSFQHRAFYNRDQCRIEMHLVSSRRQRVRCGSSVFSFLPGESIHTENSYKYDLKEFSARAARCGLRCDQTWTDENQYFAVVYLTALPRSQRMPRSSAAIG